jgi:hypothetical protein
MPDPRGLFAAPRLPGALVFVGRAPARRGASMGTAAHPGTQASGDARPTGVVRRAEASRSAGVRGSSTCSTPRLHGNSGASRNAGVGQCPTHGACFPRRGFPERWCAWVEHLLDAAPPWEQRRIQQRRRRAVPDPRDCGGLERCGGQWWVGRGGCAAPIVRNERGHPSTARLSLTPAAQPSTPPGRRAGRSRRRH